MGVPASEVGYTPAMSRREDHEVHKGHVGALGWEYFWLKRSWINQLLNFRYSHYNIKLLMNLKPFEEFRWKYAYLQTNLTLHFMYDTVSGFGGLGVAYWPLVPKFAGSNPAKSVGF